MEINLKKSYVFKLNCKSQFIFMKAPWWEVLSKQIAKAFIYTLQLDLFEDTPKLHLLSTLSAHMHTFQCFVLLSIFQQLGSACVFPPLNAGTLYGSHLAHFGFPSPKSISQRLWPPWLQLWQITFNVNHQS